MLRLALLAFALPLLCQDQDAALDKTLRGLLDEGFASLHRKEYARAEPTFRKSLDLAVSARHTWGEAEALRGLGMIHNARGNFREARQALSRALELHLRQPLDTLSAARARNDLAYTEWATGNRPVAGKLYEEALAGFEAAGERTERAKTLYNLALLASPADGQRQARIASAIQAAEELQDAHLAGKSYHLWGDTLYFLGDLRGAVDKLDRSLARLVTPADRGDRARVLISLGRLYATHQRPEAALGFYEQALAIHRELGDQQAVAYALGSLSAAHRRLGHPLEALRLAQEAAQVARQTGSRNLLSGALANLATLHLAKQEYEAARGLLQESLQLYPDAAGARLVSLANAYLGLRQPEEAIQSAEKALEISTKLGAADVTRDARYSRARALDASGQGAEAVSDVRQALAAHEKLRARIVPTDYLKRGYAESGGSLFDFAIDLYFRQGLPEEALATAEQARARAFLDLLASRSLQDQAQQATAPGPPPGSAQPGTEEPHIASLAAAPQPSVASIRQTAEAMQTTVLTYWVGRRATFIWAIPPRGEIKAARVPVAPGRIEELVRRAAGHFPDAPRRGPARPAIGEDADVRRELYRLLVQPVASCLRAAPHTALLIVPHGPLHRLSFASLKDASNRYLLEDHVLSYAPAVSLLPYAGGASTPPLPFPPGYLLVSDPRGMPPGPDGRPLPALPGAKREAASVAAILQGQRVTMLGGPTAAEPEVRERMPLHRVIHFATHGVLIDDRPFDSFLALGGRSAAGPQDGRLTVREIYDLHLNADLVVLSACRTADGPITGDGIVGLTRAFFYAGASSLLATLWDVADEPTRQLVTSFYRHLSGGQSKSEALRAAQLELLTALRQGRVRVSTPLGDTVLPEHPVFWSGFVILGRP